jgi:hypothetical protein
MTGPHPGRDRRSAVKDAFDAVQADCAGKSRDEIEHLLSDELTARGVDLPESLIRAAADVLARPRGLRGRVNVLRYLLRTLAEVAAASNALSEMLTGAHPGAGAIKDPADRTSAWVDVILDENGTSTLRSRRERLGLAAGVRDQVTVRLERAGTATSGALVAAYVDEHRVGTLTRRDGSRYLPALSAAQERGERGLLTLGLSSVEPDAQPRLRIALALTAQ